MRAGRAQKLQLAMKRDLKNYFGPGKRSLISLTSGNPITTQPPKRRDSQHNSDQNHARTEDVLAVTARQEFLFLRKVGRNSTKNKAI
jgi:hypothetical protein